MTGEFIDNALWQRFQFAAVQAETIARDMAPVHLREAITAKANKMGAGAVMIKLIANKNANPATKWTNYKYGTSDVASQEFGSGPNGETPGSFIPITPKRGSGAKYLVFAGTNEYEGYIIKTKYVNSPGIKPFQGHGYLREAAAEVERLLTEELGPEILNATKLEIQLMWSTRTKVK